MRVIVRKRHVPRCPVLWIELPDGSAAILRDGEVSLERNKHRVADVFKRTANMEFDEWELM